MSPTHRPTARGLGGQLTATHITLGWWSLLLFLSAGLVLEGLHGFKALGYLDASSEMRRLMWRLAHAHGALLSLVHIAFALTVPAVWSREGEEPPPSLRLASRSLTAALVLLPGGFFAAGAILVGGEPNPAVLLVPIGALFLFVAVGTTALCVTRAHPARKN